MVADEVNEGTGRLEHILQGRLVHAVAHNDFGHVRDQHSQALGVLLEVGVAVPINSHQRDLSARHWQRVRQVRIDEYSEKIHGPCTGRATIAQMVFKSVSTKSKLKKCKK